MLGCIVEGEAHGKPKKNQQGAAAPSQIGDPNPNNRKSPIFLPNVHRRVFFQVR